MSTGTIGTINVAVTADTNKFSRGMSRARKELTMFEKSIASTKRLLGGFAGAMAAQFTVSAIRNTVREMDNLADAAERLGATVKSFTRLTGGASLLGIDQGSFSSALDRMMKAVGSNAKAIKDIGLSAEQLKGQDLDKIFMAVAEAIKNMETPAERTAAAMAVFGKMMGPELLEFILKGRDGIEAMADEAERLSLTFSNVDAEKISNLEKIFNRAGAMVKGAGMAVVSGLAEVSPQISDPTVSDADRAWVDKLTDPQFKLVQKALSRAYAQRGGFGSGTSDDPIFQTKFSRQKRVLKGIGVDVSSATDLDNLAAAIQERQSRINARVTAGLAPKSTPGTAGVGMGGIVGLQHLNTLQRAFEQALENHRKSAPSLADEHRIESAIAGMEVAGNTPEEMAKRRTRAAQSSENAALEQGTAAAFSQSRRSQQQNQQMDIMRKQLKQDEQQTKSLQNIDKNLRDTAIVADTANFV